MKMVSNLDLIRRVPLLAILSPEQADLVAASVTKRRFKRGEVLLEQGSSSIGLLIILAGRVRVAAKGECGREVIFVTLKAGEHLGEMSLIDGGIHSANVIADAPTDVLVIQREDFVRFLPKPDTLAYSIMRALVQRLRNADERIRCFALLDVSERVARELKEMSHHDAQGRQIIPNKISRQNLAKTVGASREMVSRVMKELEAKGYIQTLDTGAVILKDYLRTEERP